MFVFSFSPKKIHKKFIYFFIAAVLTVIVTVIIIFLSCREKNTTINYENSSYETKVQSIESMIKFASQFGWKTDSQPDEVTDIIIPSRFNEVYEHYNDIQKRVGLDLSSFKGKECKKYSFKIINYPSKNDVNLNLIVLNDRVVGGDISENIMNGFMKSFADT